jgi:DNA-binding beta-propeller fold protein YncE
MPALRRWRNPLRGNFHQRYAIVIALTGEEIMIPLRVTLPAVACAIVWMASSVPAAETVAKYQVEQHWKLGGSGGWDLLTVDAQARRIYLSRSDRVVVVDADSGKAVGEIPHTEGVHGIALVPELGRGFTSNGRANTVTVFDLKTLKTLSEIKVSGENPDVIVYDPASAHIFAFNGRSHNATAIDPVSSKVVGSIDLDGKPEFAVADGKGRLFVNIEDKSEVAVIDAKKLTVESTWTLAPCEEPSGLAMDVAHQRLFSVCQNKTMIVLDSASGKQVASVPIGGGPDGAGFDARRGLAFSSNGDGTLTVVHEDDPQHFSVVENVATQKSARTMALDEKTHRIFLPAAEFGATPAATAEQPRPRPPMTPDTFTILVVAPSATP